MEHASGQCQNLDWVTGSVEAGHPAMTRGKKPTADERGDPVKAGIDPRSMLIDRKPDDNVMPLVRE